MIKKKYIAIILSFIHRLFNIFTMTTKIINCTVLGNSGSGKTTFINRTNNGKFNNSLIHPEIFFNLNNGDQIKFNITESSDMKCDNLGDCAIVLLERSEIKLSNGKIILKWIKNLQEMKIPFVVCGTKFDINPSLINKKLYNKLSTLAFNNGFKYYDLSSLSNYNIDKPWFTLIDKIKNN